jgi:hypothetical protein
MGGGDGELDDKLLSLATAVAARFGLPACGCCAALTRPLSVDESEEERVAANLAANAAAAPVRKELADIGWIYLDHRNNGMQ